LIRTEIDAVRAVHAALDQLEALWRERLDRFEQLLTTEPTGPTPCP
jgi:hypothetical protein